MHIPTSTYRVQLNKSFTFNDLDKIIAYLHTLGISTVYAAPVFNAVPGSMHGYDVVDPHTINPEIGTLDMLTTLGTKLREREMNWLQDIVPNHMAFSTHNARLMDVLERGPRSEFYTYFDIDWNNPTFNGKLMVPFLGRPLHECIDNGEVKLSFSANGFTIEYFDTAYPLSIDAYAALKDYTQDKAVCKAYWQTLEDQTSINTGYVDWKNFKERWLEKLLADKAVSGAIMASVNAINGDKNKLTDILNRQHYTLAFWKQTEKEINYRRFFTVNSLICINMQDEAVFEEYHRFVLTLFSKDIVQGLRIDHIDGLQDPSRYIKRLRATFGEHCYVIAEKILEAKEEMPESWPLQGTSGYEFLSYVSQLFTDRKGARHLLNFYYSLMPNMPSYKELVYENKKLILENHMAGEWENLVRYFFDLQLHENFSRKAIKEALAQIMLVLPVYRVYPANLPLKGRNLALMKEAFEKIRTGASSCKEEIDYLETLFTTAPEDEDKKRNVLQFLKRLMQFTGPLTAKGVEDTTFYVYNPLISHDEVGDTPSTLGITIQAFHEKMIQRQRLTPLSLNATATHDTKRGEDARLRLNVLSELPEEWEEHVLHWFEINKIFHQNVGGTMAPVVNDEYFIYQSIVGGFPENYIITEEWIQRVEEYLIKVVREAKVNSNWETPNELYEAACKNFVRQILHDSHSFLPDFLPFMRKVCGYAQQYAVGQALIKIMAPGIPDLYQGCELWDLSYVDPDNRRPVDYEKRISLLQQIQQQEKKGYESLRAFLREHQQKGAEKLFVMWKALGFRRNNAKLFIEGTYIPLKIDGEVVPVLSFIRQYKDRWAWVIVPLGIVTQSVEKEGYASYGETYIVLPEDAPQKWRNVFTGEPVQTAAGKFLLKGIFDSPGVVFFENYS